MKAPLLLALLTLSTSPLLSASRIDSRAEPAAARERHIQVAGARLFVRDIGRGQPIIVLHGGPVFDHTYLLPDMDRLSDAYRLIYYDQRGRGRSAEGVRPGDVSIESEASDLDSVRQHFALPKTAILGHSWGALLALEYALRHPNHVSHLVLVNPAPASAADSVALQEARREKLGSDADRLQAIAATPAYKEGDPDTVAEYYRILLKAGVARPEDLDKVIATLRASFTPEGTLKAREVDDRLKAETWRASGYDLAPKLAALRIPTLVVYSDGDFIPRETAEHIAAAMRGAQLVTLTGCGHFTYLECPDQVRPAIDRFFQAVQTRARGRNQAVLEGTDLHPR